MFWSWDRLWLNFHWHVDSCNKHEGRYFITWLGWIVFIKWLNNAFLVSHKGIYFLERVTNAMQCFIRFRWAPFCFYGLSKSLYLLEPSRGHFCLNRIECERKVKLGNISVTMKMTMRLMLTGKQVLCMFSDMGELSVTCICLVEARVVCWGYKRETSHSLYRNNILSIV